MRRMLVLGLISAAALAGCSAKGAASSPAPAASSAPAAPAASAASTDCGTFVLGQGGRVPDDATRCLAEALIAGGRAQLKVTRPTVEGDPIPITYTTRPDGKLDVLTDTRKDHFGAQRVTRQTCTAPTRPGHLLDLADCSNPVPA